MGLGIKVTSGTGFEALVRAVAVADPHWRSVLTDGNEVHRDARRAGGSLARDATRFGRFGWINLLGPLAETPGSRQDLLELVQGLEPAKLHGILAGGRRAQLQALVPAATLGRALHGDGSAARELRQALRSDRTVLEVAPWLLRTSAEEVKAACLRVLAAFPELAEPAPVSAQAEGLLSGAEPTALLERVAPGVRYDEVLTDIVLVSSPAVHPVIIVVDERDTTVIAHPPLAEGEPTDAAARLRLLARAAGDHMRMRILQELRSGPRSLPEICRQLDSPRTTLLHHLALLRGAGLIDVSVSGSEPNIYRLNAGGFEDFARSVQAFTIQ